MVATPKILVLPKPTLYQELFSQEADEQLHAIGQVTCNPDERNWDSGELARRIEGYDAVVTGWGTPPFTAEVLAAARDLKIIAHTAGSIKQMLPHLRFDGQVAVTHAAGAIAPAVAELTLLFILLSLRPVHQMDGLLKSDGAWNVAKNLTLGEELVGQRVGVVGAGYTGRQVIQLLRGWQTEIWVYDPYLSPDKAKTLGVRLAGLNELFAQCRIVTLQAPTTPDTYHMVGAEQLGLLQTGAVFINTARAHLVDMDALLAALQTRRFQAALDVFEEEPLPQDSPFRQLDNVILTPHIAGQSRQARQRQGAEMVAELQRFFTGEPLRYRITQEMVEIMA